MNEWWTSHKMGQKALLVFGMPKILSQQHCNPSYICKSWNSSTFVSLFHFFRSSEMSAFLFFMVSCFDFFTLVFWNRRNKFFLTLWWFFFFTIKYFNILLGLHRAYGVLYKLLLSFHISPEVEKKYLAFIHIWFTIFWLCICGGHSDPELKKAHTVSRQIWLLSLFLKLFQLR